jgi:hypothetical protein
MSEATEAQVLGRFLPIAFRFFDGGQMHSTPRPLTRLSHLPFSRIVLFALLGLTAAASNVPALGQVDPLSNVHYLMDASGSPGKVASSQIARGIRHAGSFQAVSISGPEGTDVALAKDGMFLDPIPAPVTTGMLVGSVYRFRVTSIPFRPGVELYPTVEIIDGIEPPRGREHRFPIPVVLTEDDLNLALSGALVTRVIYVEDNENATPIASTPGEQTTVDVGPRDNALQTADRLGKPVAILRIGSRVPSDLNGDLSHFLYGCPPWVPLTTAPDRQRLIEQGTWSQIESSEPAESTIHENPERDYPRVPLTR